MNEICPQDRWRIAANNEQHNFSIFLRQDPGTSKVQISSRALLDVSIIQYFQQLETSLFPPLFAECSQFSRGHIEYNRPDFFRFFPWPDPYQNSYANPHCA